MSRQRPLPYSPIPYTDNGGGRDHHPQGSETWRAPPLNEYDALMRCAPHETPETPLPVSVAARERLADAMDACLTEREQFIINATIIEKLSFRTVAEELGAPRSSIQNWQKKALAKLRTYLTEGESR